MEIIVSVAVSLDGYIDDNSPARLKLSSDQDWREVLCLRAECDAVLVGANTIRRDNPSLVIKDEDIREKRAAMGLKPDLDKITITKSMELDPEADFFVKGEGRKIVFREKRNNLASEISSDFNGVEIIELEVVDMFNIYQQLRQRGYEKILVEGGSSVLTEFIKAGYFDRIRLAVAPFFVGDCDAPRFVKEGIFLNDRDARMTTENVRLLRDTTVLNLRNNFTSEDVYFLQMAINESLKCKPSTGSYSVGAVVVTKDAEVFAGYTHETSPLNHAEEEAVLKAEVAGVSLDGAVMYSSMEPCSVRKSKNLSCSQIIIRKKFRKVVYALSEPSVFVDCQGAENMISAGIEVVELPYYGVQVKQINKHILH